MNTDSKKEKTMQVTWSKFHTTYNKSEVKKYVPTDSGIYLLWVKLKNGNWNNIYVGRTKNLESRLLDHLSDDEENELLKNNIANYKIGFEYAKVSTQSDRKGIEKYLYDYYGGECNENDPGGTPIKVNLPT